MHASLDGPRAKLRFADENINHLASALNSFFGKHPHKIVFEHDNDPEWWNAVLRNVPEIPIAFAISAGVIAHVIRSALDGLAYQLVVVNSRGTPTEKDLHQVMFPIRIFPHGDKGANPDIHERAFSPESGNFKPLGRFLPACELLQPYQPGNGDRDSPLWLLDRLNSTDKHRTVVFLTTITGKLTGIMKVPEGGTIQPDGTFITKSPPPHRWYGRVPFENGAKIASFKTPDPTKMDMNIKALPCVKFGDACIAVEGGPVIRTLRQICSHASDVVESFASDFP